MSVVGHWVNRGELRWDFALADVEALILFMKLTGDVLGCEISIATQ